MSVVKPDKYRLCTVTPCIERETEMKLKVLYFLIFAPTGSFVFSTCGLFFAIFICMSWLNCLIEAIISVGVEVKMSDE